VLLIHGDKDLDVTFEQSVLMDQELTSKKIEHQFIRMKNYGHGFDGAEGAFDTPEVKEVFARIAAFLKEHQ
jgi:dipeptidyl aminopeptidase/acylaminoacyl peptidase